MLPFFSGCITNVAVLSPAGNAPPYDPDAADYFARVIVAGDSISPDEQTAFTEFCLSLKAASVWDKLVEVTRFCGTTLTGGVVKLKYPLGGDSALGTSGPPAYRAGIGVLGDGSSYLTTGTVPFDNGMTASDSSAGVYPMNVIESDGVPLGGGSTYVNYASGLSYMTGANPAHPGRRLKVITTDGSDVKTYSSGVLQTTLAHGATNTTTAQTVLALGGGSFFYGPFYMSGYFLGTGLTASDVAALSDAWDALNSEIIQANIVDTTLTFGDSVTAGSNASDAAHRWANLVAAANGNTVDNEGVGGSTMITDAYFTYWNKVICQRPTKIYSLYGLNDIRLNDYATYNTTSFEARYNEMISDLLLMGWDQTDIYIGSPPYMNPAAYADLPPYDGGSVPRHEAFVASALAVAQANNVMYADVYQYMLDNGAVSLMSGDGIHPNDSGHAAIATAFEGATLQ